MSKTLVFFYKNCIAINVDAKQTFLYIFKNVIKMTIWWNIYNNSYKPITNTAWVRGREPTRIGDRLVLFRLYISLWITFCFCRLHMS